MALRENEQAKEQRKTILKTEAAALMLLLSLRRKLVKGKASPALIAELERQLYGAIAGIRFTARAAALNISTGTFGPGIVESGFAGQLEDIRRAKRIAANVSKLANDTLAKGGPVIKRIDQRLATIAVTENSSAFNSEHRSAVIDIAQRAGLAEVWDAELDIRTCEICAALDGVESLNGDFPGGVSPGNVHRNCRCTSHFVRRSLLH